MSAAPILQQIAVLQVTILSGPLKGRSVQINKSPFYVGREAENDLVFPDDSKMSRRHIEFRIESGRWLVRNLSNKNPLRINGNEMIETALGASNTLLRFGETEIQAQVPSVAPSPSPSSNVSLVAEQQRAVRPVTSGMPAPGLSTEQRGGSGRQTPPAYRMRAPGKEANPMLIIIIVAIVGVIGFVMLSPKAKSGKRGTIAVTQEQTILDRQKSEEVMKDLETKREQSGRNTPQYQIAQEQYLKGFRDYRQGQFSLAMTAFSAALSVYPEHELAKKYYYLAKRKFDEKIQILMIQGKRYIGKTNYRLCRSSFESVMIMLKNENDPIYKEAKQYRNECAARMEARF